MFILLFFKVHEKTFKEIKNIIKSSNKNKKTKAQKLKSELKFWILSQWKWTD